MDAVKGYGGLVVADVIDLVLARKAIDAGVDGLACISAGAGGHTGHLSPFAFVSAVRDLFDGLVTVGGGIANGAGVAGAVAAGADLVYMGTRFLATTESRAADGYKQMVVDHGPGDLVVSDGITGADASWLRPSLSAHGLDPDDLAAGGVPSYDVGQSEAKRWSQLWAAGQGLQSIRSVAPVDEVSPSSSTSSTRPQPGSRSLPAHGAGVGMSSDVVSAPRRRCRVTTGPRSRRRSPACPHPLYSGSPSRLLAWLDCPRRYRMQYLDRPRPQARPQRAHTSVGIATHNVLRDFWDLPAGHRTPAGVAELVRTSWIDVGFRDPEQSAAWRLRVRDAVTEYLRVSDRDNQPVGIERSVSLKTDEVAITGRIDRLDDREGELVVVDYKTGAPGPHRR